MRLVGHDIPNDKRVEVALTYIYGINKHNSRLIMEACSIPLDRRTKELTQAEIDKISQYIDKNFKIGGDLKSEISQNVKRLREISSYRGSRHAKNLPVRGQRTKTNARTKRGRRMTVGSGRKPAAEKT